PERVRCAHATPTLGAVLRTPPAIGRWFTDAEGRPGASPVAVLSHALWTRRYDANAGILGRPVMLGGVAMEIVGVMPASYAFPDPRVDVWIAEPLARSMGFGLWNYTGVARLRGGTTLADARAELNGLIADVPKAYPGDQLALGNVDTRLFFSGRTLKDAILGSVARGLWEHCALFPRREHPAVDRRRRDRHAARVGRRSPARRVRTGDTAAAPRDPSRCRRHRLHVRAEPGRRVRVRRNSPVARRRPP